MESGGKNVLQAEVLPQQQSACYSGYQPSAIGETTV